MESSQLTGNDSEECNSNESGWTMYLASPIHSDDVKTNDSQGSIVEDASGCSNDRSKEAYMNYDDGDYDSLASDASTGPAQVKLLGKEEKGQRNNSCRDEPGKDEQEEKSNKLPTSNDNKEGKMKKAEEKATRRGNSKRRSSSRTRFFW
ncbi:hypothetical protein ACP4OV_025330 [Aristida adscensionis]